MTWVQTVSGIPFDLLNPEPDMVRVEDIAHALSRIARFNGHTEGDPYSVAHHSMLVASLLSSWGWPPAIVREGLLHDAAEAYYGDIVSPLKRVMLAASPRDYSDFDFAAERVDIVVRKKLGLPPIQSQIVDRADLVALAIEQRDLFGPCPRDWQLAECAPLHAPCASLLYVGTDTTTRIVADSLIQWREARDRFLMLLRELDAKVNPPPVASDFV